MPRYIQTIRSRRNETAALIYGRPGDGGLQDCAHFMLGILIQVHGRLSRHESDADILVEWVVENHARLGLPETILPAISRRTGETPPTAREWTRLGRGFAALYAHDAPGTDYIGTWVTALQQGMGLNEEEAAIMGIALFYQADHHFDRFWNGLLRNHGRSTGLCDDATLFGMMTGGDTCRIAQALMPGGRLQATGLLAVDDEGDITLLPRLAGLLARRMPVVEDVRAMLLGTPRAATLPWSAFAHLGELAEVACQMLRKAVATHETGINILLYGPPGTGKTEFAATLAARIGVTLYPAGETDSTGTEPSAGERLADLRCNLRLLNTSDSVVLFDEAEDLIAPNRFGVRQGRSRVHFHRLLETAGTPVIWTVNDVGTLGPAVARRMALCIEMRQPGATVRARLWRDMARAEQVPLDADDAAALARAIPATPGIFRNALRSTRLAGGGSVMASLVATSIARATNGGVGPQAEQGGLAGYDPDLVNADCDLAGLAAQFSQPDCPRAISLLLSGPPGSGKSAWARHVAQVMGMPVVQKRASDLLGQYVGESERQIATAFAEARESGSFLIFDEVDSLLGDRRGAQRTWEVSQVNEMLTWMEQHPLPFACTTNLASRLDPASLRRFLFRARFDYLTPAQVTMAFGRFFAMPVPACLNHVDTLTPADFALVRRRMAFMKKPVAAELLVEALMAEARGRERPRVIGFHA